VRIFAIRHISSGKEEEMVDELKKLVFPFIEKVADKAGITLDSSELSELANSAELKDALSGAIEWKLETMTGTGSDKGIYGELELFIAKDSEEFEDFSTSVESQKEGVHEKIFVRVTKTEGI
jgi:hypothetical protein